MAEREYLRTLLPIIIVVIVLLTIIIIGGLASSNPDGFEWALFDFAGVDEPTEGFSGIFSFLGEGPLVDLAAGIIGISIVLVVGYLIFRLTSRKAQ
jgi:hypothetical protein